MPSCTTPSTTTTTALVIAQDPQDQHRFQHFQLYGFWKSSSTWRVRVALAAKGIHYETIPIHIFKDEQHAPWYTSKINALGQVPVLEFVDTNSNSNSNSNSSKPIIIRLSQSIAIIEFLEGAFPDRPSLVPNDVLEKAKAYEMVELINSGIQPLQNLPFLHRMELKSEQRILADDLAREVMEKGLRGLERLVVDHNQDQPAMSGPYYCLGTDAPTVVEAFLIPQMANAKRLLTNKELDMICPTLGRIDFLCEHHPWFQASHPTQQPDVGT